MNVYLNKTWYLNNFQFQICEETYPDTECYSAQCDNVTRPVYSRQCDQVMEEQCQVIVDTEWQDQCNTVDMLVDQEQCEDVTSDQCVTTQQWICEDTELEYGAPQAPPVVNDLTNSS